MRLTPDARAALDRAALSRRSFIKGSGALVVGFSVARLTEGHCIAPGPALGPASAGGFVALHCRGALPRLTEIHRIGD